MQIFNDEQKKIFSNYEDPNKIRFRRFSPDSSKGFLRRLQKFHLDRDDERFDSDQSFIYGRRDHSCQSRTGWNFTPSDRRTRPPLFSIADEESLGWRNSNVSIENQFQFQHERSSRDFLRQVNRQTFDRSLHSRVSSSRDEFDQNDKFPPSFRLWIETSPAEKPLSDEQNRWAKIFEKNNESSQILFKDQKEFQEAMDEVNKVSEPVLGKRKIQSEEKHLDF